MDDQERSEINRDRFLRNFPCRSCFSEDLNRVKNNLRECRKQWFSTVFGNRNVVYRWPIIFIGQQLLVLQLLSLKRSLTFSLHKYPEKKTPTSMSWCSHITGDSIHVKRLNWVKGSWEVTKNHYLRNTVINSMA